MSHLPALNFGRPAAGATSSLAVDAPAGKCLGYAFLDPNGL
jgi:hypothetical protein